MLMEVRQVRKKTNRLWFVTQLVPSLSPTDKRREETPKWLLHILHTRAPSEHYSPTTMNVDNILTWFPRTQNDWEVSYGVSMHNTVISTPCQTGHHHRCIDESGLHYIMHIMSRPPSSLCWVLMLPVHVILGCDGRWLILGWVYFSFAICSSILSKSISFIDCGSHVL